MRYSDIESSIPTHIRLPLSHPVLATLRIDPADWHKFQCLDEGNPGTRILSYSEPENGMMTIFVGCASEEVRTRLLDAWD